jgi:hypothetical protein
MAAMTEQALELKREYQRQWREKNRESLRQYYCDYYRKPGNAEKKKVAMEKYWNKKAAQLAE